MKMEYCPFARHCGDKSTDNEQNKQIWFCPRMDNGKPIKDYCPYDVCERPASRPKPIPKPEPIKTDQELVDEAQKTKQQLMAERFKVLRQMEEEGLSRSQAAQRLKISYYTIESLEERYGYKFNFPVKTKIPWSKYDAKIIELKRANPKMKTEEVAKIIGLKHRAVANRWTKLKQQLQAQ